MKSKVHPRYKTKYRVANWPAYNQAVRLEFPILFMTATLCGPGGVRAVIAENLLLKQQLLVLHRLASGRHT